MNKLITLAVCLTATALLHAQTTIRVTLNGSGDGTTWETACNLETAVTTAVVGDQIWVRKGMYYSIKMLTIPDSVKVYGGFAGTETALSQRNFVTNPTIVDGQQKIGSIFRLGNAAELHGLIIQNGNANGNPQKNGGGVWATENCVIESCKIINNTAMSNGGGVYANGEIKIINSAIENNTAGSNGQNVFGNCVTMSGKLIEVVSIAGCNESTFDFGEVGFKTQTTWSIPITDGVQIWSDVVVAENCNKATYYGGTSNNYYSDCRSNNVNATGNLFSWCIVARFASMLCPAPWRVPTKEDFYHLNIAMGGNYNNYISRWSGSYGWCDGSGGRSNMGAIFWTQSMFSTGNAYTLEYNTYGQVESQYNRSKNHGGLLRCVR